MTTHPRPVPAPPRLLLSLAWCWLWVRAWWLWHWHGCPVAGLLVAGRWTALDRLAEEVGQ